MKKISSLITILSLSVLSFAQQAPIFSQYYNSPLIYNPAFAGVDNQATASVIHRLQWVAIEGAPVTTAFSLSLPTNGNLGFGVNVLNDSRGILQTSTLGLAGSYTARFSQINSLTFGLSVGMGFNQIDIAEIEDLSDPALINALGQNSYLDGQFGFLWNFQNVQIGFAMPRLFKSRIISQDAFYDVEVNNRQSFLMTAATTFNVSERTTFSPYLVYRLQDQVEDQVELTAVFRRILANNKSVSLGGSYRNKYGPTMMVGMDFGKLSFGYAYEFASNQRLAGLDGTHELQLSLRFGRKFRESANLVESNENTTPSDVFYTDPGQPVVTEKPTPNVKKEPIDRQPSVGSTASTSKPPVDVVEKTRPIKVEEKTTVIEKPVVQQEEVVQEREILAQPNVQPPVVVADRPEIKFQTLKAGRSSQDMQPGFYMVLGVFSNEYNANRFTQTLRRQGFAEVEYGYNSQRNFNYVYMPGKYDADNSRNEIYRLRQIKALEEIWLLEVK